MPIPMNSMAKTITAIVQCRMRENVAKRGCCAMVTPPCR